MNQYFRRKFSLTFSSVVKEFSNFEILNYSILRNILFPYEGNFKVLVVTTMSEEETQPLLKVCTYPEPRFGEAKIKIRLPWDKILSVCYSLLLCWQVIGNCLYFVRPQRSFVKEMQLSCIQKNLKSFGSLLKPFLSSLSSSYYHEYQDSSALRQSSIG